MPNRRTSQFYLDCLVMGAALFSMFFGAGNMIFPPYLGFRAGEAWGYAFWGYYMGDIGLAVAAMLALIRAGSREGLLAPLGRVWREVLMGAVMLCLGPLVSIPRTAATTYELAILPLPGDVPMLPFCVGFFLLVWLLSSNESGLVELVGKVLAPVLVLGLLFLIGKGLITPLGPAAGAAVETNGFASGIAAGYQTMDVLAAVVFGPLILNGAARRGYTEPGQKARVAMGAGGVAGLGLLGVYAGLTYLGATARALPKTRLTRAELLAALIRALLPGAPGAVFFGLVAAVACLTTAIALTGAAGRYFSGLSGGRVSYRGAVTGICLFSALASGLGVELLVALAEPILGVVYPPVLALVLLSFSGGKLPRLSCRLGAGCAMGVGLLELLADLGIWLPGLSALPLAGLGFGWLLPSLGGAALGCILACRRGNREEG